MTLARNARDEGGISRSGINNAPKGLANMVQISNGGLDPRGLYSVHFMRIAVFVPWPASCGGMFLKPNGLWPNSKSVSFFATRRESSEQRGNLWPDVMPDYLTSLQNRFRPLGH